MSVSIDIADAEGGWIRITQGVQNQYSAIRVTMTEIKRRLGATKLRAVDDRTGATVQVMGYPGQDDTAP